MDINATRTLLRLIANKEQSGDFTTTQFNLAAERAQIEFIVHEYRKWQQTQEITDALSYLLNTTLFNVSSDGTLSFPNDYMHISSMRHIYYPAGSNEAIEVEVKEVDNGAWGQRYASSLRKPTHRFPIYTQYDGFMQFLPKNIGAVKFDYIRVPKKPIWNFTIVNNREVFNPVGSQDFELPDQTHNMICWFICSMLGINISFPTLIQYAEGKIQAEV